MSQSARSADLGELLSEGFAEEPRKPADSHLGGGIRATAYWSYDPSLEVVLAEASRLPADGQAQAAWRKRLARRPVPLLLVIQVDGASLVVGPGGDPVPVFSVDPRLLVGELVAACGLDPLDVRQRLSRALERARGAGGLAGLRNVGLFSTHYLRARLPRFAEWDELAQLGRAAVRERSLLKRLESLELEAEGKAEGKAEGIFVLRAEGRPAAAVLAYPSGHDLDRAAAGGVLPIAGLLREMEAAGVRWGILASGEVWRLYDAESPARTTSFVEVDLSKLVESAYHAALFSARALAQGGLAERVAQGSRDFAVGLGDRLRDRIYLEVVPRIAAALAGELEAADEPPRSPAQLRAVYDATLLLLYRLLFILYAEAREYLPVSASAGYRDHSLRTRLDAIAGTKERGRDFDAHARDIWSDLQETFAAIASGHSEWGVPPYNGSLFIDAPDTPVGRILGRVRPTNAALGEAYERNPHRQAGEPKPIGTTIPGNPIDL